MYMYMCIHTCPILIPLSLCKPLPPNDLLNPNPTYMSTTYSRYDESSDDVILMSHPVQNRGNESIQVVLNLQRILRIRSRSFHSHLNAFVT